MDEIWKEAGFDAPKVSYAVNPNNGDTFLVIEDNSTIYRLVNSSGIIYVIAKFRCKKVTDPDFMDGTPYYNIEDPIMHVVLCSKIDSDKDKFAIELSKEYL